MKALLRGFTSSLSHIWKICNIKACIVAQWVKPLPGTLAAHIGVPVQAAPLLILFPGKSIEEGSNAWVPATRMGNPNGILGSYLEHPWLL